MQPLDRWNAAQLGALRLLAISTLYKLVPLSPGVFKTENAAETLTKFMRESSNVKHMEYAMRVLKKLAQQHADLRAWLAESQVVHHAKACLQDSTMTSSVHNDALLLLLSLIETCDYCTDLFMSEKLVPLLITMLKTQNATDSSMPNYMMMHILSLLWTAMHRHSNCSREILESAGIDSEHERASGLQLDCRLATLCKCSTNHEEYLLRRSVSDSLRSCVNRMISYSNVCLQVFLCFSVLWSELTHLCSHRRFLC